jgi:ribonuclease-3
MNYIRNIFNSRSKHDGNFFLHLKNILGFNPKNKTLYLKAFTHRSMNIKDDKGNAINYERLEFVGDAMLSAVIASYLFSRISMRRVLGSEAVSTPSARTT